MRLHFGLALLLLGLAGLVSSATIPKPEEKFPQFVEVVIDGLVSTFGNVINRFDQLTDEQKQSLVEEFDTELRRVPLPKLQGWQWLNPLSWTKYTMQLTEYSVDLTKRLIKKARSYIEGVTDNELPDVSELMGKRATSDELPGFMREKLDKMAEEFRRQLEEIEGLNERDKDRIVGEYETELRSFPLPPLRGWEFLNPFKWVQWGADVAAFNIRIGRNLLNKAANLVQGTIGSGNQRRASDSELPDFMKKKLEEMTEKFREELEKIEGLPESKKEEYVREYESDLWDFPLPPIRGLEIFNPFKWVKWGADVATYGLRLSRNIVDKAANFVQGTLGSGRQRRAPALPDFMQKKLDQMRDEFCKQLERVEGLTDSQRRQLQKEYETEINSFPLPPIRGLEFFNPFKWVKWGADVATYGLRLSRNILDKAANLVEGTIGSGGKGETEVDTSTLPDFMQKKLDKMVENFRETLEDLGLPEEQQDELLQEFEEKLAEFPLPPLKGKDFLNPMKWLDWAKKVSAFALENTEELLQKANEYAEEAIANA